MAAINWTTKSPGLYEGVSAKGKRWIGTIRENSFDLLNIDGGSSHGLRTVNCVLPDVDRMTPGTLKVETDNAVFFYLPTEVVS